MAFGFNRRLRSLIFAFTAFLLPHTASAEVTHSILSFEDLDRWERDDHADALEVFRSTCQDIKEDDWQTLCGFAEGDPNPKEFFELFFRPVLIEDGNDPLFTGYFEPELSGSLNRTDRFQYPVY